MQAEVEAIRAEVAEQGSAKQQDVRQNPKVREAGVALARAVAEAQGYDLPLQVMEGVDVGELPVMELPQEFQKYGGIGVGVIIAPPTEAARQGGPVAA